MVLSVSDNMWNTYYSTELNLHISEINLCMKLKIVLLPISMGFMAFYELNQLAWKGNQMKFSALYMYILYMNPKTKYRFQNIA